MIARVLAMALCLSVSLSLYLSVTSRCSVEVVGRIELVFGMEAFFPTSPTLCFKEIQVSTKIRVLATLELVPELRTLKISPRHIDRRTCYRLSSKKVDAQSVINWTVVGQPS